MPVRLLQIQTCAEPLQVVAAKMELHDALAQAGKLTPIHT